MTAPLPPDAVRIRSTALARLRLYASRCPFEIGGLGQVLADADGLLITKLFILPQRVSMSDTELESAGLFDLLARLVAEGEDVRTLRLWWHSHAEMEVSWSETDLATIDNLPGEFWVAIVTNRHGDLRCRLDRFAPTRETWELPLLEVADDSEVAEELFEADIDSEILAQVQSPLPLQDLLGSYGAPPKEPETFHAHGRTE